MYIFKNKNVFESMELALLCGDCYSLTLQKGRRRDGADVKSNHFV